MSRFPIVAQEFRSYPRGYDIDKIVFKGVLYAKVKIQDEYLHLFNSHTQPTYHGIPALVKKHEQLHVFREFMVDCLKKYEYRTGELILSMGDLNTNSRIDHTLNPQEIFRDHPLLSKYTKIMSKTKVTDYEIMLNTLSGDHLDNIHDLLYLSQGNQHPVTFGESYHDAKGHKKVYETTLTDKKSQGSDQSIDYLF